MASTERNPWPLLDQQAIVDALAADGLGMLDSEAHVRGVLDEAQAAKRAERDAMLAEPVVIGDTTLEVGTLYDLTLTAWAASSRTKSKRGMLYCGTNLQQADPWGDPLAVSVTTEWRHIGAKPSILWSRVEQMAPQYIESAQAVQPNEAQQRAIDWADKEAVA